MVFLFYILIILLQIAQTWLLLAIFRNLPDTGIKRKISEALPRIQPKAGIIMPKSHFEELAEKKYLENKELGLDTDLEDLK